MNFLLLVADQLRFDWIGHSAQAKVDTPNIDRLIENGFFFAKTFTPSPICSAARACLANGNNYRSCGTKDNENVSLEKANYYRNLRDCGYDVRGVGKFDLHKADQEWGLDGSRKLQEYGFTGGIDSEGKGDAIVSYFRHGKVVGPYMNFLKEEGFLSDHLGMYLSHWDSRNKPRAHGGHWMNFSAITKLPQYAYCDDWIANNAIKMIDYFDTNKPWHLSVNFAGPHEPYDVTNEMLMSFRGKRYFSRLDFIPPPVANSQEDVEGIFVKRRNYALMIENIDLLIGKIIDSLEVNGFLDNTLVVFTSDHGEMLGDHDRWGKQLWFAPSVQVPLVISGPGILKNRISNTLVSLQDISATFLDYAKANCLSGTDSRSLKMVLEGESSVHRTSVTSGYKSWDLFFDGRYKYVRRKEELDLFYDLSEDPYELFNLIDDVAPDLVKNFETKLQQAIGETQQPLPAT